MIERNLLKTILKILEIVLEELFNNKKSLAQGNGSLVEISHIELIPLALNAGQLETTLAIDGGPDNVFITSLRGCESDPSVFGDVGIKTVVQTLIRSEGSDNGLAGINACEII
uniref:Uncharacterized protein n=1 Tax=Polytomella parva TaxID=51329 RepID=A0A7S0V811_9CHLO|mmetsp:Transcript_29871/g.54721  ORF Transcript_29871/g.54721 Transcript_29871/m.54721 type:complete len:113 (+) Transcript_29871:348-686(+)